LAATVELPEQTSLLPPRVKNTLPVVWTTLPPPV